MSDYKTIVDQVDVVAYLQKTFSDKVTDFKVISGGEGSQAYSFSVNKVEYVIRLNKHHTLGFRKDEYAAKNFGSDILPVPKIYSIGKINNELRFCISEKSKGKILTEFSTNEMTSLLPELFSVLDAVHVIDISHTIGYGEWNLEQCGESKSWKEELLAVNKRTISTAEKPGLFETSFLEKDFWDTAYTKFSELVSYCPEDRYLIHGDYGFNNTLSDGEKITGVIDWENSMYGDFLFDLAWLDFWSASEFDFQAAYLEHSSKNGKQIKDYTERMLCYKLCIGLGSLAFSSFTNQKEKYEKNKVRVTRLL